jgi:hypothetical protein
MNIRYRVGLTEAERAQLMAMLSGGKQARMSTLMGIPGGSLFRR